MIKVSQMERKVVTMTQKTKVQVKESDWKRRVKSDPDRWKSFSFSVQDLRVFCQRRTAECFDQDPKHFRIWDILCAQRIGAQ